MRILPLLFVSTILLTACAGSDEDPTKDWGPEQFYDEARERMVEKDYETAIKLFEQLEARFPYGRYAEQAQLEVAYAYFKHEEPVLAVAAVDRFLRLHPTHANVDYAYYLKGVVNFKGERGFMATLLGASDDPMEHDPKALKEAYQAFTEVVTRFPKSRYAPDAAARREFLFDAQGRYETYVAKFYCDRGAYVACVNRARYALETYPRTSAAEQAIGLSALAYKKLGINDLSDDALRVLRLNFPDSAYLQEVAAATAPR